MELVRLADGDQGPLDRRDLLLGDRQGGQVQGNGAGQGGHRRQALLPAPRRESYEIVRVGALGVLGAMGLPKSQDGMVEAIRILRLERKSAIQARTQAANQLHAVVSTAPEPLRTDLRQLSLSALIARACKGRATVPKNANSATKRVLRGLAERWRALDVEVAALDKELEALVKQTAPNLLEPSVRLGALGRALRLE